MNNFKLNLTSYVEKCWPIIEYCTIGCAIEKKIFIKYNHQIWYLYRQIYYGFGDYIKLKYYYTEKALKFYKNNKAKFLDVKSLADARRNQQLKFDPARELILEHMLPGDMFRQYLVERYIADKKMLSIKEVVKFLEKYYKVCWVENKRQDGRKSENSILPRSNRVFKQTKPIDKYDMIAYYTNEAKIIIVNFD